MVNRDEILSALRTVDDPEMPINIVDLGLVEKVDIQAQESGASVAIEILPTFVGCAALPVIESEIRRSVSALPGVSAVEVRISYSPAWTVDRITAAGRESLRRHGVTVPVRGEDQAGQAPACPFCGSAEVRQESAFGPTRCRMIWYCESCHHPFEHLKRLGSRGLVDLSLSRVTESR
jgi:ring-1,2-phenylacetyl-CoA epoxidase subunit PaaD